MQCPFRSRGIAFSTYTITASITTVAGSEWSIGITYIVTARGNLETEEIPDEAHQVTNHHQVVRELRIIIKSYSRYAPSSSSRKVDSHHHQQVVRELRTISSRTGVTHHHQVIQKVRTIIIIKSYGSYAPSSRTGVTHHHQVIR